MKQLIEFVITLVLLFLQYVVNSSVAQRVYNWTAVIIYDLEPISWPESFALVVFMACIVNNRGHVNSNKEEKPIDEKLKSDIRWIIVRSGFFLGMGWLANYYLTV